VLSFSWDVGCVLFCCAVVLCSVVFSLLSSPLSSFVRTQGAARTQSTSNLRLPSDFPSPLAT